MTAEIDHKALFDVIRRVKGAALTQADVDAVNAVLAGGAAKVAREGMRTSAAGRALIHRFEALRLTTYPDPGSANGLPVTGGWGATRDHEGKPFQLGFTADPAYWDRLFARDLADFERGVNLLLDGAPTTQGQFDALVSFAYNVGLDIDDDTAAEGLGDSTLLRLHKAGDFEGAAAEFAKWVFNDGKRMRGLERRRAAEAALYRGAA